MKPVIWNRQWFRVGLGATLIVVGLYAVTPLLFNVTSNKGIINANIVAVTSPIKGFVHYENRNVGDFVESDDILLTITNDNQDRSFLHELQTERRTLVRRVSALAQQGKELSRIKSRLDQELQKYAHFARVRFAHQGEALESDRKKFQAILAVVKRNYDRQKQLKTQGFASNVQVDDLADRIAELEAELESIEARSKSLETEQIALNSGTYIGTGRNDVPYSNQRSDEIEMLLADIAARSSEYEARIEQIDRQIDVEQDRLDRTTRYDVTSPVSGLLWRNYTYQGMAVPPENELMAVANCSTLFTDTALSSRRVSAVVLGATVKVRLLGDPDEYDGTVTRIYGASMKTVDRTQAAELSAVQGSDVVVRVAIDSTKLPKIKENFCYIGRQVSVKFPKHLTTSLLDSIKMVSSVY